MLIFRYDELANGQNASNLNSPRCMVEFSSVQSQSIRPEAFKSLIGSRVLGTLGLINIDADIFICVITKATTVATVRPGETVQRIVSVDFICLNRPGHFNELENGLIHDTYESPPQEYGGGSGLDYKDAPLEHPCSALKQVLGDGTFYYSTQFDLTNRLQNRASEQSAFDVDSLDHAFLWNAYMVDPLIRFRSHLGPTDRQQLDSSHILTSAIRGFACSITIPASSSPLKASSSRLPSSA
jgi:hypothetical protein